MSSDNPKNPHEAIMSNWAISDPEELDWGGVGMFASLSGSKLAVIKAICCDMASEAPRSDATIASECGISKNTISRYRHDPEFGMALSVAVFGVLRGNVDVILRRILQHGEKHWQALKFVLEVIGTYTPKRQQLNVNVQATAAGGRLVTVQDAVSSFLVRLVELGWSEERLIEAFAEARRQART